ERIVTSFGFIESTLTALGGSNAAFDFPAFGLSATATAHERMSASFGFIDTSLIASGTLEQRMSASFGFIDTYLSYWDVALAGPEWSLSATMSTAVSNAVAYVLNIHTGESYQWTNQAWLHIIHIGNKPYGVKSDGLYLLEGTTDSGTAINGIIKTKDTDFGSFKSKRIQSVYLNSDTATTVRPIVDGVAKNSHASSFGGRKCLLALGNQGRYWQFEVSGIQKLEGLEVLPLDAQRKVK
ncbi:MAG: hypothetical protein PHW53_05135, partial [Patescibacteria group bacterium]|nr:hypothetical protein [Patescibacteria group bacterium]